MIRKQQKRAAQGKRTAFRVGGQQVDSRRIARFLRRYRSSWDFSVSTSSPEPGELTALALLFYTYFGGNRKFFSHSRIHQRRRLT